MAVTTLCTTEEVLARLSLTPGADAEVDAVVDAIRLAVEELVLDRTGFTFVGGSKSEQHQNVQLGISVVMKYRPILPLSADPANALTLQARSLASSTFNKILGDLVDPYVGRVLPLASELTPVFPPTGGSAPWTRWRQMIWPVVVFTYNVDALGSVTNPVPAALNRAAVEWAAAVYSRPSGGALASVTVEKVSETYIKVATPPVVGMLLARYTRAVASLVF